MYAEDVKNYWQTSKTSPDTWLEKAKKEIRTAGGQVIGSQIISEEITGRAGFVLIFQLDNERFTINWPVLQSKQHNQNGAMRQSATALYHEVKAACVKAKFLGARTAFLAYLMLPNGHTASEVTSSELLELFPGPIDFPSQLLIEANHNN